MNMKKAMTESTAKSPATKIWKKVLRSVGITLVAMAGLIAISAALLGTDLTRWLTLQASVHAALPVLTLIRLLLIFCVWWKWDALVRYLLRTGRLHPAIGEDVRALRIRMTLILLCVELFVVQGFPFSALS